MSDQPESDVPAQRTARHSAGPAAITPADIAAYRAQIAQWTPRTGVGTDVHAFAAPDSGTPLSLACLHWPDEVGLAGHSDGDVVAHACCDALLSAADLGDLGGNFGTDAPEWENAAGAALLAETAKRVREAGFEIGNVAVQLIGARPRVAHRMGEAAAALSAAAGAKVSFSATTTDHLGFLGREEGLAAIATALVWPVPQA
ncbi:2-C-methyl-D-erythritol 2,4-cyclodiphosphate synthase [Actinomyces ruminicola]|uniref:2-C-methyl-D-erythritol 2,4-cyclodiphosphate synthase n=1 Tax=Actinomyces ruminicola TaxID=332524 RepID=A0A1H0F1A8_9ACTO|nr:2-C-methyl-D-erythritol 2,4-cyclodiphosphate synthase [Actinomyces ruminicola]SDN88353.1 2-C-methyl-D-erythritol 2,4-cyclodiphosphate synthase [Actinomyces ruminicola]